MSEVETIRGGIDSAIWLLNNAHNHDQPVWDEMVASARADADAARAALVFLEAAATNLIAAAENVKDVARRAGGEETEERQAARIRYTAALERLAASIKAGVA